MNFTWNDVTWQEKNNNKVKIQGEKKGNTTERRRRDRENHQETNATKYIAMSDSTRLGTKFFRQKFVYIMMALIMCQLDWAKGC